MPRRQSIPRKSKYQQESNRVSDRFRAKLMRDGKQTLSDRILRQALARAEFQAKRPGLEVLEAALRNATPIIEVKPRRVGGATYQVPVEIRGERRPEDPVGQVPLAVRHELRGEARRRPVRRDRLVLEHPRGARATRHQRAPGPVEAFAPYLLRPCLRSRTPAASSVPRMMWYFTDGRSRTLPPRTRTTECS